MGCDALRLPVLSQLWHLQSWSASWGHHRHEDAGCGKTSPINSGQHNLSSQVNRELPGPALEGQKKVLAIAKNIIWTTLRPSQKTLCFIRTLSFPLASRSYSLRVSPCSPLSPRCHPIFINISLLLNVAVNLAMLKVKAARNSWVITLAVSFCTVTLLSPWKESK